MTKNPDPEALGLVLEGAHLANVMPIIEDYVAKAHNRLDRMVYSAINSGSFSEKVAMQAWYQKATLDGMVRTMRQRVEIAKGLGPDVAHSLPEGE